MHTDTAPRRLSSPVWILCAMKDELARALADALFELDSLPCEDDAAMVGLYAVMDDLERAIRRAQAMDLSATNRQSRLAGV
jgi:hypothetical protein